MNFDDLVPDDQMTAEARGNRVRSVRGMSNLSRRTLDIRHGISASTIQSWEEGRFGGLTHKGSERFAQAMEKEGVYCSPSWLMYGVGSSPTMHQNYMKLRENNQFQDGKRNKDAEYCIEEIRLFRLHYPNGIEFMISDDSMSPFYAPGDYVAGNRLYDDQIGLLIGRRCIVESVGVGIRACLLLQGSSPDKYHLFALNVHTTKVEMPFIYNVALMSAAEIIWHRRSH